MVRAISYLERMMLGTDEDEEATHGKMEDAGMFEDENREIINDTLRQRVHLASGQF